MVGELLGHLMMSGEHYNVNILQKSFFVVMKYFVLEFLDSSLTVFIHDSTDKSLGKRTLSNFCVVTISHKHQKMKYMIKANGLGIKY